MRLLVTGCNGQVGTELIRQSRALGWRVRAVDRDSLDITDPEAVKKGIGAFMPDVVVNAAAYTAVDKAESERAAAFAVNRDGPENLAVVCAGLDIPLIHYSTDYVFDGSKSGGYVEDDPVAPPGVYGESKLGGENAVRELCPKHLILRTSWVFSAHGHNFVKTMLRLAAERESLAVVADQSGKPSSAAEISRMTLAILSRMADHWGTYHLAQPEVTCWHGFAESIFDEAKKQGVALKVKEVRAITTADYPTSARRPENSELACEKIEQVFGLTIKPWAESLSQVINEIKRNHHRI